MTTTDTTVEPHLTGRAGALAEAAALARGRLDDDVVDTADRVAAHVRDRLGHGTAHTVVALAGPTGAGKSSLFNALVGDDVSTVGVRRPTTGTAVGAVWGDDDPTLLGWLGVGHRHLVGADADLGGLVLVDLPDFDSTEAGHRLEVDRLVELVDVLVFVVDPQKYADEALHGGYLRRLAGHDEVLRFVLTKVDLIDAPDHGRVVDDLRRRLADDGVEGAVVWPVSLATGAGVDDVRAGLADVVARRRAMVARLSADLRAAAAPLRTGAGEADVGGRSRRELVRGLAAAARVDELAGAVAIEHRRRARRAMGWPVAGWLRRRRSALTGAGAGAGVGPAARGAVEAALRRFGEHAGEDAGPPWDAVVRRTAMGRTAEVATALDVRLAGAARATVGSPRWWSLVAWVQRLLLAVTAVGAGWLAVLAVVGGLRLDTGVLTPEVGDLPLPTLLLLGGILAGLVVSLLARVPAGVGARRRAGRARRRLEREVDAVADAEVVEPVAAVLSERAALARLAAAAAGER